MNRSRGLLLVAVLATIVAGGFAVARMTRPRGIDAAIATLENRSQFETAPGAAGRFAKVSDALVAESSSCRRARPREPRCDAVLSGAGWASVAAFEAFHCRLPDIEAGRRRLLRYLRATRDMRGRGGFESVPPSLPTPLHC